MNGAVEERLRLAVLGPLDVSVRGRSQALTGAIRRAVLLRLLVADGLPLTAERLVDDVWGASPPANALATLRNSVSYLRRILGPSAILTTAAGYVLVRPDRHRRAPTDPTMRAGANRLVVDADEFDAAVVTAAQYREERRLEEAHDTLVAALELWRGPAFADAQNWPWSVAEASRLEEVRSSAIEDVIALRIELGRYAQAVAAADVAVGGDPLRERRWELYMRALALAGRPVEATRAFDRYRLLLGEETGLLPGANLAALHATIVAGEPVLQSIDGDLGGQPRRTGSERRSQAEPHGSEAPSSLGRAAVFGPAMAWVHAVRPAHFVGRHAEIDQLAATVGAVFDGRSRAAILSGEPGVGKTALAADAALRAAERGAVVVCATSDERTSGSFGPFLGLAEALLRQRPRLVDQLSPGAAEALTRCLERAPLQGDLDAELGARAHALRSLIEAAASAMALMVVLDDLQWFDEASVSLTRSLVEQRVAPLAVICTVRDTEVVDAPAVSDFLAWSRRRRDDVDRITLTGLDLDASSELVAQIAGTSMTDHEAAVLSSTVYEAAQGHPFFTIELARESVDRRSRSLIVPESVREVIERRLARLGDDVTEILQVAAVLGVRFEFGLLRAVVGRDEDDVLDDLDLAVRAGLVTEDRFQVGWFSFVHALVPESIRSSMLAVRRRRLHRRVAEALDARQTGSGAVGAGSENAAALAERARHWLAGYQIGNGEEARRAVELARRASIELWSSLALRPALALLDAVGEVVAAEAPDDRYLALRNDVDRGVVLRALGEPGADIVVSAALAAHELGFGDVVINGALSLWRGTLTWRRSDARNIALLEAALSYVGEQQHAVRARLLAKLAAEHVSLEDRHLADSLAQEALRSAQASGHERTRLEVQLACLARAVPTAVDRDRELLAEALRLAAGQPSLLTKWVAAREAAQFLLRAGDGPGFRGAVDEMARLDAQFDVPFSRWMTSLYQARVAHLDGDLEKAEASILATQKLGLASGQPDARVLTWPFMIGLRWHQGRGDEQIEELEAITKLAPTSGTFAFLARVLVDHGRPDDALHLLNAAADRLDARQAFTWLAVECTWAYVAARLAISGADVPDSTLDRLAESLGPYRGCIAEAMPSLLGAVPHFLGMLAFAQRRYDEAEELFSEALERHHRLGAPFLVSWSLIERARTRQASGVPYADIHADLEEALGLAVAHRLRGLVDEVRALAARSR